MVTISSDGTLSNSFDTNLGIATPAAGILNIIGDGTFLSSSGSGNTVTMGLASGIATDGQVIIGATGGSPAWNNITAGAGVSITNGANSITITVPGGGVVNAGDNINVTAVAVVNLNETIHWPDTNAAGTTGMIYLGGAGGVGGIRFLHNYGPSAGVGGSLFIGEGAGNLTHTSPVDFNTGIGWQTLTSLTTGASNVGCGESCCRLLTTGSSNCAVGDDALNNITTGSWNLALGSDVAPGLAHAAGSSLTGSDSSNIMIANRGITGDNNTIRIGLDGSGNFQQDKCYIAGIFGATVAGASDVPVLIDATFKLGTTTSSKRFKENIEDMDIASDKLMELRPVEFNYINDPKKHRRVGLIAEEVAELLPALVIYDKEEDPYTVRYHDLPVILLNEIKKLHVKILCIEEKVAKLEGKE